MPEVKPHPSQKQLSAYNLGQLPPDEADVIESHINECETCCDTIVSLSTDDTFVGLLREARQLPTDETVDHDLAPASSTGQDVPGQLAEHPRYEILGLIGTGGMGDVYRATHRMMKRTVAIKIIKPELMRKPEAVDRFHREVTTAARLSHPNIVTAHDAEQAGDVHLLVMEYVDGTDLSKLVKDRGPLPIPDACDYVRQAAIGLQHAHEQGMVHRDIKPHNLMVLADGTVKILDFGLASLAPEVVLDSEMVEARGDLTAAGAIMGTPDFISPEQADDARTADIRSDIYSLGATLYFLLSAQPPFSEGSAMHKLQSHAQADPEPLGTVRLDVPADLADVITRMMAKDPDERFQTPEELAEALKPFSQSAELRKIVAPPTQSEPRRWTSTFLSLTAVAVLLVATLFAGFIYFLQTNHGVRIEVTPPDDQLTLGTHPLTIVDTSGKKPLGGTSGTMQDDALGITRHFFNSANGRYDIHLVDEVLTVNGDEYTLENPNDEIRIVDDRVEITRVAVRPQVGEEPRDREREEEPELLQGDWDVIAFTQNGKKEFAADKGVGMLVQIKGKTITRIQTAANGEKSEKEWGRIELNSTTNPKTIDIINPDSPDDRLLGIFELKDGALRICFAERSDVDAARGRDVKRPTKFDAPAGSEHVLLECQQKPLEVDKQPSAARIILDQGYTIIDGGKEIGSRHIVVTENDETLSIVEEYSLALQFDGAPLGIVERGVSAVYSVAGDAPLLMRGTNSTKEQGALVMHGTVEFENGEAEMRWTSYKDGGRKLDRPSKQQATVKPPPGPLVLGSTIQVVGPLLLPEDGERTVVCATFNNRVRRGKPLVEYEAGCTLKRTSRPDSEGFTITVFEPDSDKPEITWEYDSRGNCQSIQMASTTVMKSHEASEEAESETTPTSDKSAEGGDPSPNTKSVSECEVIQVALRKHFMDKYPLFAAYVNQRLDILSSPERRLDAETRRQLGELLINSPVEEVINSFPGKPYVTFTEVTQASRDEVSVVSVNLYRNSDGSSRFEVTSKRRKRRAGEPVAKGDPITEEEVDKLVQKVRRN